MFNDDSCLNYHHCYHDIQPPPPPQSSSSSSSSLSSMKNITPPLQRFVSCSSNNCCNNNRFTKNCDINHQSNHTQQNKERFQYGNYNRYYGYRKMENDQDVRIELFRSEWFN
ncbi:hypothetical protein BLA29_010604, partial [Euroglyphus maynei]